VIASVPETAMLGRQVEGSEHSGGTENGGEKEKCLSHMSEQSYNHNATAEKNDFSNWVRYAFGDVRLANELARSRNRADVARILNNRISWLQRKLLLKIWSAPCG
jgi:hypothetical protein